MEQEANGDQEEDPELNGNIIEGTILLKTHKEDIWDYVNDKFNIPERGQKAVFSRINDARRQYKSKIKKKHFVAYSTTKERLKHRPKSIPEAHFRQPITYWRSSIVQDIAKKNAINKAKQRYLHRTGPVNFARIRSKLVGLEGYVQDIDDEE
ncbi:hypothetical protein RIF29_05748 [Crotalaria pallida]|uniref:Uncharacterized protein n=1 Tax=Crotalaria pallida TaxID=3830 RepID=A0AAN9P9X8_CROPI